VKRIRALLAAAAIAFTISAATPTPTTAPATTQAPADAVTLAQPWARPGMSVIFRAEVMPGRETAERTFRVVTLLPSGRVLLEGASGEHAEKEFEKIRR